MSAKLFAILEKEKKVCHLHAFSINSHTRIFIVIFFKNQQAKETVNQIRSGCLKCK